METIGARAEPVRAEPKDAKPEPTKQNGYLFVDLKLISQRFPDEELQKKFYALIEHLGKEGWVTWQLVQTHSESLGGKAKVRETP